MDGTAKEVGSKGSIGLDLRHQFIESHDRKSRRRSSYSLGVLTTVVATARESTFGRRGCVAI